MLDSVESFSEHNSVIRTMNIWRVFQTQVTDINNANLHMQPHHCINDGVACFSSHQFSQLISSVDQSPRYLQRMHLQNHQLILNSIFLIPINFNFCWLQITFNENFVYCCTHRLLSESRWFVASRHNEPNSFHFQWTQEIHK